jgi:formylglycine-generating enzyme required for sulfatase activity
VKNGLPDIDWVRIPGGESLYQDERSTVETFYMAYPVTNAQYEAFLNAGDATATIAGGRG